MTSSGSMGFQMTSSGSMGFQMASSGSLGFQRASSGSPFSVVDASAPTSEVGHGIQKSTTNGEMLLDTECQSKWRKLAIIISFEKFLLSEQWRQYDEDVAEIKRTTLNHDQAMILTGWLETANASFQARRSVDQSRILEDVKEDPMV